VIDAVTGKAKEAVTNVTCQECGGKGALLVVPDQSQRRPTTGRVVSVGDKVKHYAVGESALYSNFAGHAMDFPNGNKNAVLRVLHESELLAKVDGHLTLSRVRKQSDTVGV
jgi:co-chaperonin GroES (HSP10)